jgi:hypothetical protein
MRPAGSVVLFLALVAFAGLEDAREHLLGRVSERVFLARQVGIPGLGVPDLQAGVGANDDAVLLQARVGAKNTRL